MTYRAKIEKAAKQLIGWTDEQLQHAWDNPMLRKDGIVSIRGAKFCDAILFEQKRRRTERNAAAFQYVGMGNDLDLYRY